MERIEHILGFVKGKYINKISRIEQELLGHKNLQTTMIYTHVATKNVLGIMNRPQQVAGYQKIDNNTVIARNPESFRDDEAIPNKEIATLRSQ